MSPPTERAGAFATPALTKTAPTATSKTSGPTQLARVLKLLLLHDEVCSARFYRDYIPRFSVWIHQLRKAGYGISKRPCDLPNHDHVGRCWLYRIEALPSEPVL